jgi:hypothetical protein
VASAPAVASIVAPLVGGGACGNRTGNIAHPARFIRLRWASAPPNGECAMAYHDSPHHHISNGLHPAIYVGLAISAAWLVVSAWIFFGSEGHYAGYSVAVVTGFFTVAAAIPWIMWRVARNNVGADETDLERTTFPDWWNGEVETSEGRVEGWDAAVEVLMPLGVAAIGMTLIGVIFRLTAGS